MTDRLETESTARAWLQQPVKALDLLAREAAQQRQQQLTKPGGSLGQLETVAIELAGMQGCVCPQLDHISISLFAADHGIAGEGVSAFPQAVTAQMIANFAHGGAAISVAARELGAQLEVVNLGTVTPLAELAGVRDQTIAAGTQSFLAAPAMTDAQLDAALNAGRAAVIRAIAGDAQLFIGGEMGIGNTTAATALACAQLALTPAQLAGPGTGLDEAGVNRKVMVLEQALQHHHSELKSPESILRCLGGFEIVALCGAYLHAAQKGLPVLVDGFICSVAALLACAIQPEVRNWLLFGHRSAEPGHQLVLAALGAEPLLQLSLRLGEGSGAAVAAPLLRMACAIHGGMATFAEAGVANRDD